MQSSHIRHLCQRWWDSSHLTFEVILFVCLYVCLFFTLIYKIQTTNRDPKGIFESNSHCMQLWILKGDVLDDETTHVHCLVCIFSQYFFGRTDLKISTQKIFKILYAVKTVFISLFASLIAASLTISNQK